MAKLTKTPVRMKAGGLNQLVDPVDLPPGRTLEVFDLEQRHERGSMSKRAGSTVVTRATDTGAQIANGRDIVASDSQRLVRTKTAIFGHSPGRDLWAQKALVQNISAPDAPTVTLFGYRPASVQIGNLVYHFVGDFGEAADVLAEMVGIGNGVTVDISNRPSWWYYRVVDAVSGIEIVGPKTIGTVIGRECIPIVLGGFVWAFFGPDAQRKIYVAKFDPNAPATAPVVTTFYDAGFPRINDWDVAADGMVIISGQILPATAGTNPANDVVAQLSTATGLPTGAGTVGLATTNVVAAGLLQCTKWVGNWLPTVAGQRRYFTRVELSSAKAYLTAIDAAAMTFVSEFDVPILHNTSHAVGYYEASNSTIVTLSHGAGLNPETVTTQYAPISLAGVAVTNSFWPTGIMFASRPFLYDSAWYVLGRHDDNGANLQRGSYLMTVTGTILGRTIHGNGGDSAQRASVLSADGSHEGFIQQAPRVVGTTVKGVTNSWDGAQYVTREIAFTFDDRTLRMAQVAGRNETLVPGAWPLHIVRSNVVEMIPMYPRLPPQLAQVATAGGGTAPGFPYSAPNGTAYAFCYCWSYRYENGERVISNPSPMGTALITALNRTFNIVMNPLTIINAQQATIGAGKIQGGWTIEVYMTLGVPVQAPGGATEIAAAKAAAALATPFLQFSIPNDTGGTLSFTLAQSSIRTDEALYTDGGVELPNLAPPPFKLAIGWNDYTLLAYLNQVWVSKPKRDGFGYGYHGRLVETITEGSNEITAFGLIDAGIMTAHKADGIWVLSGEGPDGAQGQNMFKATRLPFESGAISQAACVRTDAGLIYQDARDFGFYLLRRDFSRIYIGAGVESYRNRVIKAATYNAVKNQAVFFVEGS